MVHKRSVAILYCLFEFVESVRNIALKVFDEEFTTAAISVSYDVIHCKEAEQFIFREAGVFVIEQPFAPAGQILIRV